MLLVSDHHIITKETEEQRERGWSKRSLCTFLFGILIGRTNSIPSLLPGATSVGRTTLDDPATDIDTTETTPPIKFLSYRRSPNCSFPTPPTSFQPYSQFGGSAITRFLCSECLAQGWVALADHGGHVANLSLTRLVTAGMG